jgi:hypothetical protein
MSRSNWRKAFLRQARSENAVRHRLNHPRVEYSHRLHYFQMVAEKLAKGLTVDPDSHEPPPTSHQSLVRLLQMLKGWSHIRNQLGYKDANTFRSFIDSLLSIAEQIERLAPSGVRLTEPNPEYPWMDPATAIVRAPCDYSFEAFGHQNWKVAKLSDLIDSLLRITA